MKSYCWSSGLIEFGRRLPEGALLIADGPSRCLRSAVTVCARHGYRPGVLLVPGVPEASMLKTDPLLALSDFRRRVERLLRRPMLYCSKS